MKLRKTLIVFTILIVTVGMLFAAGAKEEKQQIALVPPAMISPYYASVISGAKEAVARLGYELITLAPESESDYIKQVEIVEDLIIQGVDGLILCAINADAIVSAVKKANQANIPVIMFNTQNELADGVVTSYVRYDQYEGGAKVAEFVGKYFNGVANAAIIEGLPSDHTTERKGGFSDRARELFPGVKIVASQPGDWEREKGMNAASNMIQANPSIDVFFGLSDEMALGALRAVEEAGSKARVVGFDGNPNAVESVIAGKLLCTLSIGGVETGVKTIETMDKILKGQKVDKIINVETTVITVDNAKDFLPK